MLAAGMYGHSLMIISRGCLLYHFGVMFRTMGDSLTDVISPPLIFRYDGINGMPAAQQSVVFEKVPCINVL